MQTTFKPAPAARTPACRPGSRPRPFARAHAAARPVQTRATDSAQQAAEAPVAGAVQLLKQAAATSAVPKADVFRALWQLEKQKLPEEGWGERLGGGPPGGRRWRLVFTAGAKDVKEGAKTGQGSGFYFPLTAVQRWDASAQQIENGIYLGQIAALAFRGPYEYQQKAKKLSFDFTELRLRFGPAWLPIRIPSAKKEKKADPFFLFFYVDEQIACARGRGGGYAIWARTTPEWELKAGVSL